VSFIYKKSIRASLLRQTSPASRGAASSKKDVRPRAGIVEYALRIDRANSQTEMRIRQKSKDTPILICLIEEKIRHYRFFQGACARLKLERNTPERRIGLSQFEAGVPRFVVPPNDQRFGLAASLWMDQSNLLVHR
jgi:hypothetical protein